MISNVLKQRLLLICVVFAGLNPLQASTIHDYFNDLTAFQADFTQKLFNVDQELIEQSNGVITVKRPNKFRLEYQKPYFQLYIADGIKLLSYDQDLEQVIIKPQHGLLENSPAMILSNPDSLDKNYTVTSQGKDNGLEWYELIPKKEDSQFDRIQLGFDAQQLRIMELHDGFGQTTRLLLTKMQKNIAINASEFTFEAPAGVDIIEQ